MTRKTLSLTKEMDRERIKQSWADVHHGLPQHQRIEMMLERLVDALCDEIEGK